MKNSKKNLFFKNIVIFVITICMLFSAAIPALATDEDVRSVGDGVLYLERQYNGRAYKRGSCFLINEDTIITANHCIKLTKAEYNTIQAMTEKEFVDWFKEKLCEITHDEFQENWCGRRIEKFDVVEI